MQKLGRIPGGCWVVVLILPALVPLARTGCFASHDGIFHVYRLAALLLWQTAALLQEGHPGRFWPRRGLLGLLLGLGLLISLHACGEVEWLPVTASDGMLLGDRLLLPEVVYVIAP